MDVQWYPGHMTKARRRMQENLKLIDLVIELTDARTVLSGRNPDIDTLSAGKARVLVMTKADLADPAVNEAWLYRMKEQGIFAACTDVRQKNGLRQIRSLIDEACREKRERDARRGIKNRPVRAMICGIPNVGKSTFINSLAGRASTKTGNRPGVTKGEQWIRADRSVELLDTPGILWPKFEDPEVGMRLAVCGTIRDELLNRMQLALWLLDFVKEQYPGLVAARYQTDETAGREALTEAIARSRSLVKPGGEPDTDRAAGAILDDFRSGRLGRISLERPCT